MNFLFIDKWLWQMFQGDPIAWSLFISMFVIIFLSLALFVGWWRMPEPAKRMLLNNLLGKGNPILVIAYDDQSVRFLTPRLSKEGVFYDRKMGVHFLPRMASDANEKLGKNEKNSLTKAFHVRGTNSRLYLAYAGQATAVNSEIASLIEKDGEEKANPGTIKVPKEKLAAVIQFIKEKVVTIKPMWTTQFLDPRKIKAYMPYAYTDSQLASHEQEIREEMRTEFHRGSTEGLVLLMLVGLFILGIVSLAKQLGAF